jgi:hypothetical protein
VRVLADLAHQGLAVVLGHPVLGLDEVAGVDARVERRLARDLVGRADAFGTSSRSLPIVSIACVYIDPRARLSIN